MNKTIQFFLISFIAFQVNAQQSDTLFTIQGKPVFLDEFKRLFFNNSEEGQTYTAQEYLDLFVNYKLKIKEARTLGYDTLPAFKNEYEGYRKQLITSFTKNPDIEKSLVKEAYDRSLEEVRAKNILIAVPQEASPQDTLKAYNRLMEAYNQLKNGADFDRIAMAYSEPKIAENQIDLGFFTVFQMVYPFESMAYKTKVGEVSKPFRSRYGYHLLQVTDKRPANGKVMVKHIQLVPAENDSVYKIKSNLIQKIYGELQAGAVFDSLAKKYSEDKSTASAGGTLRPFGIGTLQIKTFEEEAFALKEGDYSKPFQTQFGWHIVQLTHREPVPSFEVQQPQLEMNVKRDERSELIETARLDWLRSIYKSTIFDKNKTAVLLGAKRLLDKQIQPEVALQDKVIFQIEDKRFLAKYFFESLKKSNNNAVEKRFAEFFKNQLEQYHETHLEQYNAEFRDIVQKYHDGLLVYNIMENEVWKKSQNDTLGMKIFFDENRSKYQPEKGKGFLIAQSPKISALDKVLKYYQNSDVSSLSELQQSKKLFKKVTFASVSAVDLKKMTQSTLNSSTEFREGTIVSGNNGTSYAIVKRVELPSEQAVFNPSNPMLYNDYQVFVEQKWLRELREKYQASICPDGIQKVEQLIK